MLITHRTPLTRTLGIRKQIRKYSFSSSLEEGQFIAFLSLLDWANQKNPDEGAHFDGNPSFKDNFMLCVTSVCLFSQKKVSFYPV